VAGRIRDEDVALVRERVSITDVISEQVTLKSAGGGNLKGLCPFHDEKTASFTVAPARGVYFCPGCGAGGDAIRFVMEVDHLTFVEAVERLAGRAGIQLRYTDAGPDPVRKVGQRQRLVAAHAEAAKFYAEQLTTPGARIAREFLAARGFDQAAAQRYGCGFAPDAWDRLTHHLHKLGYTSQELVLAGLAREARSGGLIDRFRRRLLWPIRELSGDVIGFGARKLFEHDDGPKYLNTPETQLYKKSHVLYGIDQAKREIAKQGRVVIVEGYTDVMACHIAGVPIAVATCGTAFGGDHISVLRRLLLDTDRYAGEIIFTFDGDAAGQKAALRAFEDDQRFVAQTFIAVGPDNMDPCELRLARGDAAVRDLVASREPLLAFALRSIAGRHDLDTAEGRTNALRAATPYMLKIRNWDLREQYVRVLSGIIGSDPDDVRRSLRSAAHRAAEPLDERRPRPATIGEPRRLVEREALKIALQSPVLAGPMFDSVDVSAYAYPPHAEIRTAVARAGGASPATAGPVWIERVRDHCADLAAQALITELAVEPLRLDGEPDPRYVEVTLARLRLPSLEDRIKGLKAKLQRLNPVQNVEEHLRLFGELVPLEQKARALRDRAAGAL
jgi:DNA primase